MHCAVCRKDRPCPHEVQLTPEQQKSLRKLTGREPPMVFHYCEPCWRVLSDRERGAALMRGVYQTALVNMGHPNAAKAGERLQAFLLDKTMKGKPS